MAASNQPQSQSSTALSAAHRAHLRASGISDAVIAARGYWTETSVAELRALDFAPSQCRVPALVVPLHNTAGRQAGYQIRPDQPRLNAQGKPVKYDSPVGSHPMIDVPPPVLPLLRDPAVPLLVTEGTKKADAAASQGLCCISLAGVYGWRGRGRHGARMTLLDLDDIPFDDRETLLAFDSDVSRKPTVRDALVRLKAALERRGARAQIVLLPDLEGLDKTGLDDFLVAGHGLDDLRGHIGPLPPVPAAPLVAPSGARFMGVPRGR